MEKKMKKIQNAREMRCALLLARKLDVHAADHERSNSMSDFCQIISAEAQRLCDGLNGPETLYMVGWVYQNRANQFLKVQQNHKFKFKSKM